jgi:uncharacterized membrane protein
MYIHSLEMWCYGFALVAALFFVFARFFDFFRLHRVRRIR